MVRRKQRKSRNARRKRYDERISAAHTLAAKFNMIVITAFCSGSLTGNFLLIKRNNSPMIILEGCLSKIEQYLDRLGRMKVFL